MLIAQVINGLLRLDQSVTTTASVEAGVGGLVLAATAYAARGIRVNAVAPGMVRTPLTDA